MSVTDKTKSRAVRTFQWLKVVIALLSILTLTLIYVFWTPDPKNKLGELIMNSIPSAIVVLIAIPILYLVFYREGLAVSDFEKEIKSDYIAETIMTELSNKLKELNSSPALIGFYETYRHVRWAELISEGRATFDIVVYYYDSWVNANYDALRSYFTRPHARMRLFVADPTNIEILANVHRMFPEYTHDVVKSKILRTGQRLKSALTEAGGPADRLEVYFVPHILNYSLQCIDDRILVLSVFEMFRMNKIDSPAFVIDISKSRHLDQFWRKELTGLLSKSKRVEI